MNDAPEGISDLLRRAVVEYPVEEIGEGLTDNIARVDIETRLPELLRSTLEDDNLVIEASVGQGRWTSIPWIALMHPDETTHIQQGVYVVYLFEPQEDRVTLTLNQGVTELKDEHGTADAREQLRDTARQVRQKIQPDRFNAGELEFPHASNRNKLYEQGTIFYKRYTADSFPDNNTVTRDLQTLIETYYEYLSSEPLVRSRSIYQVPIESSGGQEWAKYEQTVQQDVPRSDIEDICSVPVTHEEIRVWGTGELDQIEAGDYLMFAETEGYYGGEYTLLAQVADTTMLDPETADVFADAVGWDDIADEVRPNLVFLDSIWEAEIERNRFWNILGVQSWPVDTYSSVDPDRTGSSFFDEYTSVEGFLDEIKGQQIYSEESTKPEAADIYQSSEAAIRDVRERISDASVGNDWLLHRLGTQLIESWSLALAEDTPSGAVAPSTANTFDQIRAIYERLTEDLKTKADQLKIGSLPEFSPAETLFFSWVRILQADADVDGATLTQAHLDHILEETYAVAAGGGDDKQETDHPLVRQAQRAETTVYKFTAPPDYWLTTYAYAALGLGPDTQETWTELTAGDVILFHSTQTPSEDAFESQQSGLIGAGIVQTTTRKPDDTAWWYDERRSRPKADAFSQLVAFDRLYATGTMDAIDFSTAIFEKSTETVDAELAALTANELSFERANDICISAGDSGFPRHQTILSLDDPAVVQSLLTALSSRLASVSPVALHKPFEGRLDSAEILGQLYFPDDKGEEIVTQVEGALRAGKNVILTGPPGTGKTVIARRIGEYLAAEYPYLYSGAQVTTATADWSTFDTVGGYMPSEADIEGTQLSFTPGLVLNRFKTQQDNIQCNEALIIDELNRADIDKAFGQLFTVLSGQPVQLPYTKDGHEIKLAPAAERSVPAPHQYHVPRAWNLLATLNTYDKTSLYEMSYAFMRRFSFIRVPAPALQHRDDDELRALLREYMSVWPHEIEDTAPHEIEDTASPEIDPLIAVGRVWRAANGAIDDRAIGPAVIRDIVGALAATPAIPWERRLTQAVISYIFPQLEGVPKRTRIVSDIAAVEHVDDALLDQAARDMLQVPAEVGADGS